MQNDPNRVPFSPTECLKRYSVAGDTRSLQKVLMPAHRCGGLGSGGGRVRANPG